VAERGIISQGKDEYEASRKRGIPKGKGITTPRWVMFPVGVASAVLGVIALVVDSGDDGLVTLSLAKAPVFILVGLLFMWVSITWSYMVRKSLSRFFGWCLVVIGLAGVVLNDESLINLPWEAALYFAVGASFLAAGYWKRPFDYRD
jgi:hypothetical protein